MALTDIAVTYGFLAASLVALWLPPLRLSDKMMLPVWPVLFAAACISAMLSAIVAPQAVLVLLGFALLCYAANKCPSPPLKVVLLFAAGAMTLALALHRFAGFANPSLVTDVQLSPLSPPVTHHLNFDTSAAGLILFAAFCIPARSRQEWRDVGRQAPLILGTAIVVLLLGMAIGFVKVDLKLTSYTPIFFVTNLLFTCITEEAFFRGFLQQKLGLAMRRWKAGPIIALVIASVLFGIAHARGGPALIALASLAGLGYGYAYLRSGRIEAAILAHITLNTLHFVAFTYPRAL